MIRNLHEQVHMEAKALNQLISEHNELTKTISEHKEAIKPNLRHDPSRPQAKHEFLGSLNFEELKKDFQSLFANWEGNEEKPKLEKVQEIEGLPSKGKTHTFYDVSSLLSSSGPLSYHPILGLGDEDLSSIPLNKMLSWYPKSKV